MIGFPFLEANIDDHPENPPGTSKSQGIRSCLGAARRCGWARNKYSLAQNDVTALPSFIRIGR